MARIFLRSPLISRFVPDGFLYDVFLSHSAKDKALIRLLAERLKAVGLKVWFGESVLMPGDTLKYLRSRSAFVRTLARDFANTLPDGQTLLLDAPQSERVRERPPKSAFMSETLVAETPELYKTSHHRAVDPESANKARGTKP